MRIVIAFGIFLAGFYSNAQNPVRGNTNTDKSSGFIVDADEKGNTYAVLVGISKYAHIENLLYADDDAVLFHNYLTEQSICSRQNIALLIDSAATTSRFYYELTKIKSKILPNDRLIIYFAGHGDVESDLESGFLLTYNSEKNNYAATSVDITMLQRYVDAFVKKQVKVTLITDACRSGKLAGGQAGATSTLSALTSNFNNCIKVLSCQPNQLSQEKYYLNGGHGIFTYHLVNGLNGLADKNKDQAISLRELDLYLDQVSTETDQKQAPKVEGNPQSILFQYNDSLLQVAANRVRNAAQPNFNLNRDASEQKFNRNNYYQLFKKQIKQGNLITPEENNAYQTILDATRIHPDSELIRSMKMELLLVIEDEVQGFINQILRAENRFEQNRKPDAIKYYNLMRACVRLADKDDPRFQELAAKETYFQSRLIYYSNDSSRFKEILQKLKQQALISNPALIYNELGTLSFHTGEVDSSFYYYQKAHQYTPTWIYPISNTGWNYHLIGKDSLALIYLGRALEMEPNHPWVNGAIGEVYSGQKKYDLAEKFIKQALRNDPNSVHHLQVYGSLLQELNNYSDSDSVYSKALSLDSSQFESWVGWGIAKVNQGDTGAAEPTMAKLFLLGPKTVLHFQTLGILAQGLNKSELADSLFSIAISMDSTLPQSWNGLGIAKGSKKDYVGAEQAFRQVIKYNPKFGPSWYNLACIYSLKNKLDLSLEYLEQAIRNGYADFDFFESDPDLANIRSSNKYKQLIDKYKKPIKR